MSNPAYIDENDPNLETNALQYEPELALISTESGLGVIHQIANQALSCLQPPGLLMLEHEWKQAHQVRDILRSQGFIDCASKTDFSAQERISYGRYL